MVGVKSLLSLEYPAARTCRFLICIGTNLSVSKSFPKDDVLPLPKNAQTSFLQMVDFIIHFMAAKHPY